MVMSGNSGIHCRIVVRECCCKTKNLPQRTETTQRGIAGEWLGNGVGHLTPALSPERRGRRRAQTIKKARSGERAVGNGLEEGSGVGGFGSLFFGLLLP